MIFIFFLSANEVIKKINEKLITSSPIDINIFDGLLAAIGWNVGKEIVIVAIWEIYKVWKKDIQGIDCHSVFVPILCAVGYCIGNFLQTLYAMNDNGEILLDAFPIFFLYIFVENTVRGSCREVASSFLYYLIAHVSTNNENQSVITEINNNGNIQVDTSHILKL